MHNTGEPDPQHMLYDQAEVMFAIAASRSPRALSGSLLATRRDANASSPSFVVA